MSPKRSQKKTQVVFKNIKSLIPKDLNINPLSIVESTKNKIENFYVEQKKRKEKEKIRLEKKRKIDEKKELLNQKKQE